MREVGNYSSYFAGDAFFALSLIRAERRVGSFSLGDALARADFGACWGVNGREVRVVEVDARTGSGGDAGTPVGEGERAAFGEGMGLMLRAFLDGVRTTSSSSLVSSRARLRLGEPAGAGVSSVLMLPVLPCRRRGSGLMSRSSIDKGTVASKSSSFVSNDRDLRFNVDGDSGS